MEVDKGGDMPAGQVAQGARPQIASEVQQRMDATLADAEAVIFYDGVCGLCDQFIQFCLARDKKRKFRYGMQQGETFAQVAPHFPELADLSTVVLAERLSPPPPGGGQDWQSGWRYSRHSTASLRAIRKLGGLWSVAGVLLVIPPPLRNIVYRLIARNRYRMFGKVDACRLPTPEERAQFLP